EVTATSAQTGAQLSSGRLKTTVVEGPGDFDAELGSLPAIDESLTVDAWGSREAAGLAPEPGSASASALDEGLVAKLTEAPTAGLSAQLRARGLNNVVIEGVAPLEPGSKIVGTAKTLRFVPNREDLFKSHGGGYNAQKRAFDSIRPGEVVVIEARGESGSGTLGDILALRAKSQGATGVITDGGVRDSAEVAGILPVFATAKNPAVLGRRHVPWESDVAVACGNATVLPGDVIVADDDGAIVIPRDLVEEGVDAALAKETEDGWVAEQVAAGHPIERLFPPKGDWKAKFEDWKASRCAPSPHRPPPARHATRARRPDLPARAQTRARPDRARARHLGGAGPRSHPSARGRWARDLRTQCRGTGGHGRPGLLRAVDGGRRDPRRCGHGTGQGPPRRR